MVPVTHKVARASVTIQRELGRLISSRLKDPRLPDMVTVTHVDLARDLSTARVFISTPGDDEENALAVTALESAAGRLSRDLQSRMRIRRMPKLLFSVDDQVARGENMDQMIDKVIAEDHKLRTRRDSE